MSESSRAETLIETGQWSYYDGGVAAGEPIRRNNQQSRQKPYRPPRGISYQQPSDNDLDPHMGGVKRVSLEQREVNRDGIDNTTKELQSKELAGVTDEKERTHLLALQRARNEKRAARRAIQDEGGRVVL